MKKKALDLIITIVDGAGQADVLVCARGGGGMLRERMALLSSLWAAGIKAETAPAAAPSMTAQYEHASARSIAWLVVLQPDTLSASDTVKVCAGSCSLQIPLMIPIACLSHHYMARGSRKGSPIFSIFLTTLLILCVILLQVKNIDKRSEVDVPFGVVPKFLAAQLGQPVSHATAAVAELEEQDDEEAVVPAMDRRRRRSDRRN